MVDHDLEEENMMPGARLEKPAPPAAQGGSTMSYTIPIGPYHPSLEEPVHARLTVDGEKIVGAKVEIK